MTSNNTKVTYELIENDIHCFNINDSSRQTIEDIFSKLSEIRHSGLYDTQCRYLFGSENISELPVRYLIQRASKWEKEQTFLPPTKTALLIKTNGLMLFAINTLVKTFNKYDSQTRMFTLDQRTEAIEWLCSKD